METGLTDSQVKRALTRLQERELIKRSGRQELFRPTRTFESEHRGIKVFARMVHMTKSAAQGIILSQMHYWFSAGKDQKVRVTIKHNGELWWAISHDALALQTGLSAREARSAVDSLKRRGLIHTIVRRYAGRNAIHVRFNPGGFFPAWRDHYSTWMAIQGKKRYQGYGEL